MSRGGKREVEGEDGELFETVGCSVVTVISVLLGSRQC